jgi:hypothetical protein
MTTEITTVNIILKSSGGDVYSIPESMKDQFVLLDEAVQELLLGEEEWFLALDEFNRVFGDYVKD